MAKCITVYLGVIPACGMKQEREFDGYLSYFIYIIYISTVKLKRTCKFLLILELMKTLIHLTCCASCVSLF